MTEKLKMNDIDAFHCPIAKEIMRDPVSTCERTAMQAWLAHHDTNPNTEGPTEAVTTWTPREDFCVF